MKVNPRLKGEKNLELKLVGNLIIEVDNGLGFVSLLFHGPNRCDNGTVVITESWRENRESVTIDSYGYVRRFFVG